MPRLRECLIYDKKSYIIKELSGNQGLQRGNRICGLSSIDATIGGYYSRNHATLMGSLPFSAPISFWKVNA